MTIYRVFHDDCQGISGNQVPTDNYSLSRHEDKGSGFGSAVPQYIDQDSTASWGPYQGSTMIRLNYEGDGSSSYGFSQLRFSPPSNWNGGNSLFMRIRVRPDSNLSKVSNPNPGMHALRWNDNAGSNDSDCLVSVVSGPVDAVSMIANGSNLWTGPPDLDPPRPFTDSTQWHVIEGYWKYDPTTHATYWNNGVIPKNSSQDPADSDGFSWTSAKFAIFDFCSNWSSANFPPDGANMWYVGDFELFCDATWGLGWDEATTGLMSDATIAVAAAGGATARGSRIRRAMRGPF